MSFAAPAQCTGSAVSMFGSSDAALNLVTVSGVSGLGDAGIIRTGATISFGASGTALRNRDHSCMTLRVSQAGGKVDELDVPLFFDGYGPDTDGDGLKDNQDRCPAESGADGVSPDTDGDGVKDNADACPGAAGIAPSGCPSPVTAPSIPTVTAPMTPLTTPAAEPRCSTVRLKGKSLTAARKALQRANCKLGKVTKPKRVRKGAKLVVTKQSGNGPVNVTLGVKHRQRAAEAPHAIRLGGERALELVA